MNAHPGTAAEFADSNKCICCRRSKSGESFFELTFDRIIGFENVPIDFDFGPGEWDADIDVFQEARRQGCQRCAVALDMVTTWKEDNPRNDWRHLSVWKECDLFSVAADVRVYLSASRKVELNANNRNYVALALVSANRRYPQAKFVQIMRSFKTNELKTEIQVAWQRISGIDGTWSHCHYHMKTPHPMMSYKGVSTT
jgi:hypothetical protein